MIGSIESIFADELGIDPGLLGDDFAYNATPEWDSASHMVLVLAIEEKFGVEFDPDEVVSMTSIRKIREILARKGHRAD
ncbi:MAG: acyl carrier protein [Caulobacteraceae bacterium]